GGPVPRERREVVRLRVVRVRVLAGGRVEVDAVEIRVQLVKLVEQLAQSLRAGGTDRAAPPLGEVAGTGEQLVPLPPRGLGVRLEVVETPADTRGAERSAHSHVRSVQSAGTRCDTESACGTAGPSGASRSSQASAWASARRSRRAAPAGLPSPPCRRCRAPGTRGSIRA